jgi:DNA-binding protein HU-beta
MTKAELIERVHAKKSLPRALTKKAVGQIVDAVFLEMGDYFIRTKLTRNAATKLTYPGFGTFSKRHRGERIVKNPQTGDPITIPPQSTITFSPGQELRGLLNRDGKRYAKSNGKITSKVAAKITGKSAGKITGKITSKITSKTNGSNGIPGDPP